MKRVVVVRHAKAVPYGYENDFNRDLRNRGKDDAKLVSTHLKEKNIFPSVIYSSPAKRAIKTARIYAENLNFPQKKIIQEDDIYDGLTTSDFLYLIKNISDKHETVFFFGHNPGFYYFANNLVNSGIDYLPTSGTVVVDYEVDSWKQLETRLGSLNLFLTPKMFK